MLAQFAADPAAVDQLSGKLVYEILQPGQPPLPGVVAEPVVTFGSAAALENAIRARQLPSGIFGVLYDPEAWTFTPTSEQQDPVRPRPPRRRPWRMPTGCGSSSRPRSTSPASWARRCTGPRWRQFLSLDLIGRLAKVADVVELQAQSLEQSTGAYTAFVARPRLRPARASPGIDLLAGLSTNPPGAPVRSPAADRGHPGHPVRWWMATGSTFPGPGPSARPAMPRARRSAVQALQARP